MPPPELEKAASAGVSAPPQVDVAALVERLREELAGGANGVAADRGRLVAVRHRAERVWAVTAERPLPRRPGLKGLVAHPVKRVLRPFLRWYVEPLAAEQRMFNDAVLKLLDAIVEELDRTVKAGEAAPPPAAVRQRADAFRDYVSFAAQMRGSTADVRARQSVYVEDFRDAAPVLDIGCGRGEFLGLLRDAGVEARGVDADADMVAFARGEGLAVEQADGLAYLEAIPDGSLGGVFAAQLVEHLPPAALLRLLELSARKLRPGGPLVAETINPLSPLALRAYYADLTHAQPLVPETLVLLAKEAGFRRVETRFLNPPLEADELPDVDERIREILFAPLDYAILART